MRLTTWKDPVSHVTYKKNDVIYVTGTVYVQQNNYESVSVREKVYNKAFYFKHYDDTYVHRIGITNETHFNQPWWIDASSIVSGGAKEIHTITFDNGDPAELVEPGTKEIQKEYGTSVPLEVIPPIKEGYDFLGWSNTKNGSVIWKLNGLYTDQKSATLYAVYKQKEFKVLFDAKTNGGLEDIQKTYKYGQELEVLPIAVKKYYKFIGWFTKPVGGIEIDLHEKIYEEKHYYAQFKADASIHTRKGNTWTKGFPHKKQKDKFIKGHAYVFKGGRWRKGIG